MEVEQRDSYFKFVLHSHLFTKKKATSIRGRAQCFPPQLETLLGLLRVCIVDYMQIRQGVETDGSISCNGYWPFQRRQGRARHCSGCVFKCLFSSTDKAPASQKKKKMSEQTTCGEEDGYADGCTRFHESL